MCASAIGIFCSYFRTLSGASRLALQPISSSSVFHFTLFGPRLDNEVAQQLVGQIVASTALAHTRRIGAIAACNLRAAFIDALAAVRREQESTHDKGDGVEGEGDRDWNPSDKARNLLASDEALVAHSLVRALRDVATALDSDASANSASLHKSPASVADLATRGIMLGSSAMARTKGEIASSLTERTQGVKSSRAMEKAGPLVTLSSTLTLPSG